MHIKSLTSWKRKGHTFKENCLQISRQTWTEVLQHTLLNLGNTRSPKNARKCMLLFSKLSLFFLSIEFYNINSSTCSLPVGLYVYRIVGGHQVSSSSPWSVQCIIKTGGKKHRLNEAARLMLFATYALSMTKNGTVTFFLKHKVVHLHRLLSEMTSGDMNALLLLRSKDMIFFSFSTKR